MARDCQEQEERCYRCNDTGHKSRDCDREKDQLGCYNCKEKGHLVRDCPTKVDVCFACNLEGHISRKFQTYSNIICWILICIFLSIFPFHMYYHRQLSKRTAKKDYITTTVEVLQQQQESTTQYYKQIITNLLNQEICDDKLIIPFRFLFFHLY